MHIIQLLEFPCTFTYQTSWENNNIYKLYILPYHKCQLVLKSLHTLLTYTSQYSFTRHSNRMTYSMFDILSIQYKPQSNKNRDIHIPDVITPSSTPFTPAACPSALSLTKWPGTLPPSSLWAPDTYVLKALWVYDPLSSPPTAFLDHMLSVPTQSLDKRNIIIFYI